MRYAIGGQVKNWVVDGQHRLAALIKHGFGEWMVDVKIHTDVKDDTRASQLFLLLNAKLTVGPFDKFLNELNAREDAAVGISDIARKYGLRIDRQCGDGVLACPVSLKKAYSKDGGRALDRAIGIITAAYGKQANALEGKLIEGLSLITAANNGNLDEHGLVKKLAKYEGGASSLIGDSRGWLRVKNGIAKCIATQIIETYNSGRRTGRLDPL